MDHQTDSFSASAGGDITVHSAADAAAWFALSVPAADRRRRTLHVVCLAAGRPVNPQICVEDLPSPVRASTAERTMEPLARVIADAHPGAAIAVALTRPAGALVTEDERTWCAALRRAVARYGLRVHSVHVLGRTGCRFVTLDDAA